MNKKVKWNKTVPKPGPEHFQADRVWISNLNLWLADTEFSYEKKQKLQHLFGSHYVRMFLFSIA